jgi:ferredoxin
VELNGRRVRTSPLSSFRVARLIAGILKQWIETGAFLLSPAAEPLSLKGSAGPMVQRTPRRGRPSSVRRPVLLGQDFMAWDESVCHGCGACLSICPSGVFSRDEDWMIGANVSLCRECLQCENVCPVGAIRLRVSPPHHRAGSK